MNELGEFLNRLKSHYHRSSFLASDPLSFVHLYQDPLDQEAVAVLSALLSYGNVKQIKNSIRHCLTVIESMSQSPSYFVRGLAEPKFQKLATEKFKPVYHRFNTGEDLILLFRLMSQSWNDFGSFGAHFLSFLKPGDKNIENALNLFIDEIKKRARGRAQESFYFLLNAPRDGSACKRWCMLLRWMGRKDLIDPGLWVQGGELCLRHEWKRHLSAHQLIMPLDTHVGRISRYISLTNRQIMNWKASLEITENLKKVSFEDPTQFDFSMARLGILSLCQKGFSKKICSKCDLQAVCRFVENISSVKTASAVN